MFETGKNAANIIQEKGLSQISDSSEIEKILDDVIAANPDVVSQIKSGKEKAKGFIVGQAMKLSKGKANPGILNELLSKKLQV